ncbi:TIR domain-containing protein [Fundicoccus culcitae]|uniref:Toll/interleukin-1 receptor domain-containing protein n=1 Tax=Fundicoccus culcitae TaxID=2969821 RepID=A0ABY5P902_9LACT|nr:hypothetical protein [Fundicoccus culcitae]UUX35226.1 toll/interleukin-1 receptor domain-containing protein [Fundicoccus culcitae]
MYREKDNHLVSIGKKKRYNPESPEKFFYSSQKVKNILSVGVREKYNAKYDEQKVKKERAELEEYRYKKNKVIYDRINNAKINAQNVNPSYMRYYIKKYHTKGISTQEKMLIALELSKFDTKEVNEFFYKLNDSERNNQIREFAFNHLQKFGHYVVLRKRFKGKKKSYQLDKVNFDSMRPKDLYERFQSDAINNKQTYDFFVSHSLKDQIIVRDIVLKLNQDNKTCYIDWGIDDHFLKREFVNVYTEEVLKVRMEQSKNLLLIRTDNSEQSKWVEFEIEYFSSLDKPLYEVKSLPPGESELKIERYYIKDKGEL